MHLSIIIPAFNEEKRIESTIKKVYEHFSLIKKFELIIVNDGSSDKTEKLILSLKKESLQLINHKENKGKGASVKSGVEVAVGELILFMDADCSASLDSFKDLYSSIKAGNDIAIGSRAQKESKLKAKFSRKIIGRIFAFYVTLILGLKIKDTQCGFKLYKKEVLIKLCKLQKINDFAFDVELLYLAKKLNYKVAEIPISWKHVSGSKVNVLKDGIKMFIDCLYIRINHR